MPGKQLSGAAKRKLSKQKQEEDRARENDRRKSDGMPGREFEDLPPAPLGDPLRAMVWWNDVLLTCADKVLRDTQMPLEQKIRFLMDGCAKAGMIRDKSAESKAMLEALRKKNEKQEAAGLEPNASRSDPPKIPRPAG